jgi:D-3-phosphoglycerate dehydrogenase
MTHKVLVSDALSDAGLAALRAAPGLDVEYAPGLKEDELAARIGPFEALVIRSGSKVTAKVLEKADSLRVIGRAGIGVDNVDVKAASKRGIVVMNTPTGNAVTTAEHALALLFSLARKVPQATASMKGGKWEKSKFSGRELSGKTLGVLGLGTIGRIVADRAKGLRMNVVAYDPVLSQERAASLGVELVGKDELFARADAITAHTPLTKETTGLVNDDAIAKMKKGVLLVNCARGGVYDEAALLRGLASGKIGGLALDVFVKEPVAPDHPLLGRDDVIVTPHLGASTEEAQERVVLEIIDQVAAFLEGGTITNAVNVPSLSREAASRLGPYLVLARKLGEFIAQVEGIHPAQIELECTGEPAELGARPILHSAVAGMLARFLDGPINDVSAPAVAADRGITLREVVGSRKTKASLVVVRARSENGLAMAAEGALDPDGGPRLLRWGDYEVNAELAGHAIVLFNDDKPGVIGAVGTLLGQRGINVAQVHMGHSRVTKNAVSVWTVDAPTSDEVLAEIEKAPNVTRAVRVELSVAAATTSSSR